MSPFSLPSFLSSSPPHPRRRSSSSSSPLLTTAQAAVMCLLVGTAVFLLLQRGYKRVRDQRRALSSERARMELLAAERDGTVVDKEAKKGKGVGARNGEEVRASEGMGGARARAGKGKSGKGKSKEMDKERRSQNTAMVATSTTASTSVNSMALKNEETVRSTSPPQIITTYPSLSGLASQLSPAASGSSDFSASAPPSPLEEIAHEQHPRASGSGTSKINAADRDNEVEMLVIGVDDEGWQIAPGLNASIGSDEFYPAPSSSYKSPGKASSVAMSRAGAPKQGLPAFPPSMSPPRERSSSRGAGKQGPSGHLTVAAVQQISEGGQKKKRRSGEGSVHGSEMSGSDSRGPSISSGGAKKKWVPGSGAKPADWDGPLPTVEEVEGLKKKVEELERERGKRGEEVEGLKKDNGRLKGDLEKARRAGAKKVDAGEAGELVELRRENSRLSEELVRIKSGKDHTEKRANSRDQRGGGEEVAKLKGEVERLRGAERMWKSRAEGGERVLQEFGARENDYQKIQAEAQSSYQELLAQFVAARHRCAQLENAIQQDRLSRSGPSPISPMMHSVSGQITSPNGVGGYNMVNMNGGGFMTSPYLHPQPSQASGTVSHPPSPGMGGMNGHSPGNQMGLQHPIPHQQMPSPWGNVPFTYPIPVTPQNGSPQPSNIDASPRHSQDFSRNVAWSVLKNRGGAPGSPSPSNGNVNGPPLFFVSNDGDFLQQQNGRAFHTSLSDGDMAMEAADIYNAGEEFRNGIPATTSLPNGLVLSRNGTEQIEGKSTAHGNGIPMGGSSSPTMPNMPSPTENEDLDALTIPLFASINHSPGQLQAVQQAMEREQQERGRRTAARRGSLPFELLPTPSPSASPGSMVAGLRNIANEGRDDHPEGRLMGRLGSDGSGYESIEMFGGTDRSLSTTATSSVDEDRKEGDLDKDGIEATAVDESQPDPSETS